MKSITQDILYKQVVVEYSRRHGVTNAAIKFKMYRKTIYRWREKYDGTAKSLKNKSRRPHGHPRQHKEEEIKMKADLKKYNNEVENVYGFLYDSLVNLTSLKSKETGQHILRTKEYMKVMLRKYEEFYKEGLLASDTEIENIATAATLHDIGKIGIPDNILNKPGKLTDEEYEIMKKHTIIGRETLESTYSDKLSSEVLEYAKDITLHHHEKYTGKGYPEGLKGDEITVI